MGKNNATLLGAILVRQANLALSKLQAALDIQKRTGEQLGKILVENSGITQEQLDSALAKQQDLRSDDD